MRRFSCPERSVARPLSAIDEARPPPLLPRPVDRELAVADALREPLGVTCRGVLAIGADELAQRREQARLRHAVAVDAVKPGLCPRLVQIAEGNLFLLVIRNRLASAERMHCWPRD